MISMSTRTRGERKPATTLAHAHGIAPPHAWPAPLRTVYVSGCLADARSADGALGSGYEVLGCADDGVGSADDGVGSADDGVGSADDGVGSADGGVGSADGVDGSGDGEVGSTDGEVGSTDGEVGSTDGEVGSTDGEVGSTDGVDGSGDGEAGSTDGVDGSGDGEAGSTEGVDGSGDGEVGSTDGEAGSPATVWSADGEVDPAATSRGANGVVVSAAPTSSSTSGGAGRPGVTLPPELGGVSGVRSTRRDGLGAGLRSSNAALPSSTGPGTSSGSSPALTITPATSTSPDDTAPVSTLLYRAAACRPCPRPTREGRQWPSSGRGAR
jgi:hypothetical protein